MSSRSNIRHLAPFPLASPPKLTLLVLSPGMSTFSTKGGLYERAQKRFGVTDGKKLFTYSFFEKQRLEAMVRLLPFSR